MRSGSRLVLAVLAASLLAASVSPLISSKSDNPCAACHSNYSMYLDILEGDAGNTLPAALNDGESLTVAVVLKVTCNAPNYRIMSSITATLASQNGLFSVATPTYSVGSLANGQTATASWKISPLASGNDVLLITAQGRNSHNNAQFSDTYSPSPSIAVTKAAVDLPPAIALTAPAPGLRLTGGTDVPVSWVVTDEDRATCVVGLFYSTDDFNSVNETIAIGIPANQGYTWNAPPIDSAAVKLKATVVDGKGNFNQTILGGHLTIDSTPPAVLSVLPSDNAKEVADSAILQVRFSEPVVESTAQLAFTISPNPGGVTWGWNAELTTMTASHDPFDAGTTYACTISSGVKDLSSPGNIYQGTYSWSFTTPQVIVPVPSIIVSSPAGGERFYWGDTTTIGWTASGGTGTLAINLSISENDTAGPFMPITNGISNSGQYALSMPRLVSDACLVEATAYDLNGKESRSISGVFSLAQDLSLEADLPTAGASFLAGNATLINWTGTGGYGAVSVDVHFQKDANSTAQSTLSGLPRSGSRSWTAPELNTDSARLILNATDGWGRSVEVSSGPFTIFTKDPPPPIRPNRRPVVLFDIREAKLTTGSLATFDASGSFDPDGDSLYYIWDFGDGTGTINTTTSILTHVYLDGGDYLLALTVGDARNETGQSMVVHVEAQAGTVATSGENWTVLTFGIIVILLGGVGVLYAVATRPGPEPASGPEPAREQASVPVPEPAREHPPVPGPEPAPAPIPVRPACPPANAKTTDDDNLPVTQYVCKPSRNASRPSFECVPIPPGNPEPSETTFTEVNEDTPDPAPPLAPLVFDRDKCVGCGGCSRRCPTKAISMMDGLPGAVATGKKPRKIPMLDGKSCVVCEECVRNCVKGAISPVPGFKGKRRS